MDDYPDNKDNEDWEEGREVDIDLLYQSGLQAGMSFDMVSQMTTGNLVDYIISFNRLHEIKAKDDKEVKIRDASQADFDNF